MDAETSRSRSLFIVERRRDPDSGVTVTIYDRDHPDNDAFTDDDDARWIVCCEKHDLYESYDDYDEAQALLLSSSTWCDDCAREAGVSVEEDDEAADGADGAES